MTEYRLAAFRHWQTMKLPTWPISTSGDRFQDIHLLCRPKARQRGKAGG